MQLTLREHDGIEARGCKSADGQSGTHLTGLHTIIWLSLLPLLMARTGAANLHHTTQG